MKEKKQKAESVSDIVIIKEKTSGMQKMLDSVPVVITKQEELKSASDIINGIKMLSKYITERKEKYVAPAKAIIAEARDQYDPYIKECKNAEEILKARATKYILEQEVLAKKEEEKIAARVEKGTLKPETAIKKLEALPEVQKTVRSDQGSALRMSKRKVAKIEKPELVPDEYWVIDDVRVRREALERDKKGLPQIPGVVITEEAGLASF
jgi:hypothetical protein